MLSLRKIIKLLHKEGFVEKKTSGGSHRKFVKDKRVVTIAIHGLGNTVPKKTFGRIMQQAGLK